jgi:DNA-directed RNA polymerase subunit RPC12/RpoP
MTNYALRLNCSACHAFTRYTRQLDDPTTVVRCKDCGKKHSDDSVWMVDTHTTYERDDSGALLEEPI